MRGGFVTFAFNKETAQYALRICCTLGRVSVAMINKWLSNAHMLFTTLPNRATQETLLIECLTCLKPRLG